MTKQSDFYNYKAANDELFGSYTASESTKFTKVGTESKQSRIDLFKLAVFSGCIDVLADFNPSSLIHMFTADEMYDFQKQLNTLNNTNYNLEWELYYSATTPEGDGVWHDEEDGGVWYDERDDGIWVD